MPRESYSPFVGRRYGWCLSYRGRSGSFFRNAPPRPHPRRLPNKARMSEGNRWQSKGREKCKKDKGAERREERKRVIGKEGAVRPVNRCRWKPLIRQTLHRLTTTRPSPRLLYGVSHNLPHKQEIYKRKWFYINFHYYLFKKTVCNFNEVACSYQIIDWRIFSQNLDNYLEQLLKAIFFEKNALI